MTIKAQTGPGADPARDDRVRDGRHECPWPGCTERVPRHLWGCKAHWYRVPRALRERCTWAWHYGGIADHVAALEAIASWLKRQPPEQAALFPASTSGRPR